MIGLQCLRVAVPRLPESLRLPYLKGTWGKVVPTCPAEASEVSAVVFDILEAIIWSVVLVKRFRQTARLFREYPQRLPRTRGPEHAGTCK